MYIIGLTGNIATGKSTVAAMLKRLGAFVIDADKVAHEVMRAGTSVHQQIVGHFGPSVLARDGEIDRAVLGEIVFSDPRALVALESLVHPPVVGETLCRLDRACRPVGVVEAIKLLEAGMWIHCQAVWVVCCSREQQIERLVRGRCLSIAQACLRIDAQGQCAQQTAQVDVVIDNSNGLEWTWTQVLLAWNGVPGVEHVSMDEQ